MSVPGVHPRETPLMKMLPKLAKPSSMANSFEVQPNYKQTSSYLARWTQQLVISTALSLSTRRLV
jgi:hypothetical protein